MQTQTLGSYSLSRPVHPLCRCKAASFAGFPRAAVPLHSAGVCFFSAGAELLAVPLQLYRGLPLLAVKSLLHRDGAAPATLCHLGNCRAAG